MLRLRASSRSTKLVLLLPVPLSSVIIIIIISCWELHTSAGSKSFDATVRQVFRRDNAIQPGDTVSLLAVQAVDNGGFSILIPHSPDHAHYPAPVSLQDMSHWVSAGYPPTLTLGKSENFWQLSKNLMSNFSLLDISTNRIINSVRPQISECCKYGVC